MGVLRQVFMEIIRRPIRSTLLLMAAVVSALFCVFGSFLNSASESFYRVFASVTGYSIGVEIDAYDFSQWSSLIDRIMEDDSIVAYNNGVEASLECEPIDFFNVSYDETVHSKDDNSEVILYGYMDISCSSLFRNHKLSLLAGDYPTEDSPGVMIDRNLAEQNQLSVGDVLKLVYMGKEYSLAVRGIYEANEIPQVEADTSQQGYYEDAQESFVFCNFSIILEMNPSQEINIVEFFLDDYGNMEGCLSYIKEIVYALGEPCVVMDTVEAQVSQMSQVFIMLNQMNQVVIGIAYVLCTAIFAIMTVLWLRTHRRTIAIYRVLGQNDIKTLAMVSAEIVMITIPGLIISIAAGVLFLMHHSEGIMYQLLDWCEISINEQNYAMENWNFGFDTVELLQKSAILEIMVILITMCFTAVFVRMPVRKLRRS